jgi:hypothetical protein
MSKASQPDLQQAQALFAAAMLDVASVAPSLPLFSAAMDRRESGISLYRGNLSAIWSQSLANAYPVLYQLVGAEFFEQMARAYGQAHPSQSGDLNKFGRDLPGFLAESMSAAYPYFADVAVLEWQVHRAYYAADATILTLTELLAQVAQSGRDVQSVRLKMHSASQLHQSAYASVAIWRAHQVNLAEPQLEALPVDLSMANYGLISRREWQVNVTELDQAGFLALRALSKGHTLEAALELAMQQDPQFDIAAQLTIWFSAGAFSAFSL